MQINTHSNISILKSYLEAWRKSNHFSRETVAQLIVEAHERLGFDIESGVRFEPHTQDAYDRQRVNADRIFRWLDDSSKESNLLSFNMFTSILSVLPKDMAAGCMNEILGKIGFSIHRSDVESVEVLEVNQGLIEIAKESSEAIQAVARLNVSANRDALSKAEKELADAAESMGHLRSMIAGALAKLKGKQV